jgi:transcriptional regulator with XRE-family HTH domain
MSTVGENISLMRKQLGWTQEELAKMMGYKSKSTINKIELGINDIPQSKIKQFADVLGTTPAHLMGWYNEDELNNSPSEMELSEG